MPAFSLSVDGHKQAAGTLEPGYTLQRRFIVPADGKFLRLKHDYQTDEWHYKPRDAATKTEVPETVHLNPYETNDFVPLTREREEFVLKTIHIADPSVVWEDLLVRWQGLTETSVCFTDGCPG